MVISCSNNIVTISATGATTIEYNFDGSSTYTTYTQPFEISATVTVYAKASNGVGEISGSQQCNYKDISEMPFYVENTSNEQATVSITKSNTSAPTLTIYKSTDGTTWTSMGTTSTTAITAEVPANGKLYLRCNSSGWGNNGDGNCINCNVSHKVGGNVMSLLYGSSFNGQTEFPSGGGTYDFCYLFKNNTYLTNTSDLRLPATTLKSNCYTSMFYGCTELTSAPELPATTLTWGCYSSMFNGCSSLTSAPELPATTLTSYCYSSMFNGCTSIKYIKCLATDISASGCTNNWVNNVAKNGTFVKNPSMSSWTTGTSGRPSGWNVVNATD